MNPNSPTQNHAARILIVEDDEATRSSLADGLKLDGHTVAIADDVAAARRQLRKSSVDIMLLDVNLPDQSGYDLLREIRAGKVGGDDAPARHLPVMMLSGRATEIDRVRGFELGCDDYVTKPYSFGELRGRMRAVLRRARGCDDVDVTQIRTLTIDRRARTVRVDGQLVSLTVKEYSLLLALAEDPERVFTREQLLRSVWGFRSAGSTRTLDAHACRLRAKLGIGREHYVVNLWGVGYRLLDHGDDES
jgi:DNA-binding response OmpR family regulator